MDHVEQSFRSLAEDFTKVIQPSDTNTALGAIQGTPREGTPALHFLHMLLKESPELEREMARLCQALVREQEILEEGIRLEREGETERAKQKEKTPNIQVGDLRLTLAGDKNEEITRLKEQIV